MIASRLDELLSDPGRWGIEQEIKTAVASSLATLDEGVTITRTSYFNHSFVPDLVLRWPELERLVYLRPQLDPHRLTEDIESLTDGLPIFCGLRASSNGWALPDVRKRLEAKRQTLATEKEAVDQFQPREGLVDEVLGSAVLRGGRGVITAE